MKLPLTFLFLYLSGVPAPPIGGDHFAKNIYVYKNGENDCGYTETDSSIGEDASEINGKPLEIFIDGICEGVLVVQEKEEENLTSDSYEVRVFYTVEGGEEELIDEEQLAEVFLDSVDNDDNGLHVSLKCSVIDDDLAGEEEEGSQTRTSPSMMMTLFSLLPLFYFVNDKSTKKVLLLSCLIALIPLSSSEWRSAILQEVPQGAQPCGHFEVVVKLPSDVFFSSVDLDDGIEFYCEHPLCSTLNEEEEEGGAGDDDNVEEVEGGFLEEEGYFVEEEGFLLEEGGEFVGEEGEDFFFEEEGGDFVEEGGNIIEEGGDIVEEEVEFVVEEVFVEEVVLEEEDGDRGDVWVVPDVPDVNPEDGVLRNVHVGPFVGVSAAVVTVGLVFIFMRKKRKNYYAINTAVDVPHQ